MKVKGFTFVEFVDNEIFAHQWCWNVLDDEDRFEECYLNECIINLKWLTVIFKIIDSLITISQVIYSQSIYFYFLYIKSFSCYTMRGWIIKRINLFQKIYKIDKFRSTLSEENYLSWLLLKDSASKKDVEKETSHFNQIKSKLLEKPSFKKPNKSSKKSFKKPILTIIPSKNSWTKHSSNFNHIKLIFNNKINN